jgi:hypothetical protein
VTIGDWERTGINKEYSKTKSRKQRKKKNVTGKENEGVSEDGRDNLVGLAITSHHNTLEVPRKQSG